MIHSRPDGFYGSMLASESVLDGMTILHGPGGCRALASSYVSRYVPREFTTIEGDFFFHRSRIPCSFVDADDYIYGASKKIGMIMDMLRSKDLRFAVVLESPGASLIGDKLQDEVMGSEMSGKTVIIGNCMMSETFACGYDRTLSMITRKLTARTEKERKKVNLVGLPYIAKGCFSLVKELHKLLEMMGLEVISDIGIACTVDQIRESSKAVANVCICPEYFRETGEYYQDELGIPTVRGPLGAPVGYDALRAWILEIAKATDSDPEPVIKMIDDEENEVFRFVGAGLSLGEYAGGYAFSILSEPSIALPLMTFIMKRLHLAPYCIELTEHDDIYEKEILALLDKVHCRDASDRIFGSGFSEVMFGPGSMAEYYKQKGICRTAVDIFVPSKDYLDIAPKSIIGLDGCRRIVEKVLNTR